MLKIKMFFCMYVCLGFFIFTPFVCIGEESDDIYVPLDAVQIQGTIDSIVVHGEAQGDIIIDDILYRLTSTTEFFTSERIPVSLASFSEGQFVNLVARKSNLLKMWPAEREEGEAPREIQKPRENTLQLKDGVWVN